MSEESTETDDQEDGWVVIPAGRTAAERREAYSVDWQAPANELTLIDRLRRLRRIFPRIR